MLTPLDEQVGGQIPYRGGVQEGVGREVEVLQGLGLLEAGALQAQAEALGFAAFDLVLEQELQELQIPELIVAGLG